MSVAWQHEEREEEMKWLGFIWMCLFVAWAFVVFVMGNPKLAADIFAGGLVVLLGSVGLYFSWPSNGESK